MDRDKIFVRIYVARFLTRLQSLTPHVIASTSKAFFYRNRTTVKCPRNQVIKYLEYFLNTITLIPYYIYKHIVNVIVML